MYCHLDHGHVECEGYLIGQAKPYQSRDKKNSHDDDDRANVIFNLRSNWQLAMGNVMSP